MNDLLAFFDLFTATRPGWEFDALPLDVAGFWRNVTPTAPASLVREWLEAPPEGVGPLDRLESAKVFALCTGWLEPHWALRGQFPRSPDVPGHAVALLRSYLYPSLTGAAARKAVLQAALAQWGPYAVWNSLAEYVPRDSIALISVVRWRTEDVRRVCGLLLRWLEKPDARDPTTRILDCAQALRVPWPRGYALFSANCHELNPNPLKVVEAYLLPLPFILVQDAPKSLGDLSFLVGENPLRDS